MNGCWKCVRRSEFPESGGSRLLCHRCALTNPDLESSKLAAYVQEMMVPADTVSPDIECLSVLAGLGTQSAGPSTADSLPPPVGFPPLFASLSDPPPGGMLWPSESDHREKTFGCGPGQHTIASDGNIPNFSDLENPPSNRFDYPSGLGVGETGLILAPTTVQQTHPFGCYDFPGVHEQMSSLFYEAAEASSLDLTHLPQDGVSASSLPPSSMTSGQNSLFQALFSLGNSPQNITMPARLSSRSIASTNESAQSLSDRRDFPVLDEDEDSEGIENLVCGALVLDRNVQSNSLPFVLYSYAVWMRRMMFDPIRPASRTKDYIIRHYSESEQSRHRTILIGNLLRAIATQPSFHLDYLPMLTTLRTTMCQTLISSAKRKLNPSREIDIRESVRALYHTLELIVISKFGPFSTTLQFMREAAPVFRRACPESLDQPVHLPSLLIHPEANMRHYPVMDVFFSAMTGFPMNIRYDTTIRSTFDVPLLDITDHLGLSWLYGQPDHLTLILARINMLYHDFGANVDLTVIRELEQDIRGFKAIPGASPDPSMTVARLVVQEGWRQAAFIYLYMGLGGVNAQDTRVQRAQRRFMKLLNDIKPALKPDIHLASCMIFVGIATQLLKERDTLISRLRVLPESGRPDSCLSSGIQALLDIWARTESESRPAVWSDLQWANSRILRM